MNSNKSGKNYINLVNKKGERTGIIDKLEAHKQGALHEAFSIFIFNENRELLIQKRALNKYHSGGLWTNTCCSHPKINENLEIAAHRRLEEEMGFDCKIKNINSLIYKTGKLSNGLIEYEFDYIFTGFIRKDLPIVPNKDEVSNYRWIKITDLTRELKNNPQNFTEWLRIIMKNYNFFKMI